MKKFFLTTTLIGAAAFGLAGCSGGAANSSGSPNVNRAMSNVANSIINGASPQTNSNSINANLSNSTSSSTAPNGFMNEAAQGGMAEVELGKLAASKAQNADVKAFGNLMVADHSKANDELKALAAKKSVTLPTEVSAKQKEDMEKLSKLSGAEFDKEYVKMMVEDHEKDVAEFKKNSETNSDADVKAFAAKTLPTLETHLTKIKEIQGKMK